MTQPHTTPSQPVGQGPRIRRAVRTNGPVDPSRPVATVRAAGPSLTRRKPVEPAQPEQAPAPVETYSPFKVDRPPTRDEIAVWHDGFLADAQAQIDDPAVATGPMHFHHAEVGADRVGSDWHALLDRVEAEGIEPATAGKMAGRILVDAMTGLPRADVATMDVPMSQADQLVAYREEVAGAETRADRQRDAAVAATAAEADPDAELERDVDLVAIGIRYEQNRELASGAGAEQKRYKAAADADQRELLQAFVDSGQLHLSLVMPGSGENRVLAPKSRIWPKLLPVVDGDGHAVLDEKDRPVTHSTVQRIEALRADGLDDLIEEKISTTGLNDLFAGLTSNEELAEKYPNLARIYELSYEWSVSSTKGRSGRQRTPTAAEVAGGRRTAGE